MIEAKVVEDSFNLHGNRLCTLQLKYPRFIHAEFMTHRVFSRNASSSRAIPVATMIANTLAAPATFVHVGKNQPGMQAREEVDAEAREAFEVEWRQLLQINADFAKRWAEDYGIHKQIANRVLEPWQHISVIASSTEWDNFFALRDHPDAQPEFQELAHCMKVAMSGSVPVERGWVASTVPMEDIDLISAEHWHLPYVTQEERATLVPSALIKVSVARCARVSYLTHDGQNPSLTDDLKLYARLAEHQPPHASPLEHQACGTGGHVRSGNFTGWRQFRQILGV